MMFSGVGGPWHAWGGRAGGLELVLSPNQSGVVEDACETWCGAEGRTIGFLLSLAPVCFWFQTKPREFLVLSFVHYWRLQTEIISRLCRLSKLSKTGGGNKI